MQGAENIKVFCVGEVYHGLLHSMFSETFRPDAFTEYSAVIILVNAYSIADECLGLS